MAKAFACTYKERNEMMRNTGCVPSRTKYTISLYKYPDKESFIARKIIVGNILHNDYNNGKNAAEKVRLMLVEFNWRSHCKNEVLIKCRLEVESEIIEKENNLNTADLKALIKSRNESNRTQNFDTFEEGLRRELREKMGLNFRDIKDESLTPTISTEEEIKKIMMERVTDYQHNTFHYDYDTPENRREKPVETIGV